MDDFHMEWAPPGIDTTRPSVARIHDAILGGVDNFEVDRAVAAKLKASVPNIQDLAWANRAALGRGVTYLAGEARVGQLIDLGSGLPTLENTHDVAYYANPAIRVVYVDNDPIVEVQSRPMLRESTQAAMVTADVREPDGVLGHPVVTRMIDFSRPVGLIMLGLLHLMHDHEDPYGLVSAYMNAVPSGSYLFASHFCASGEEAAKLEGTLLNLVGTGLFRSRDEIARFFNGLVFVEPGLVHLPELRPEEPITRQLEPWERIILVGIARKP